MSHQLLFNGTNVYHHFGPAQGKWTNHTMNSYGIGLEGQEPFTLASFKDLVSLFDVPDDARFQFGRAGGLYIRWDDKS